MHHPFPWPSGWCIEGSKRMSGVSNNCDIFRSGQLIWANGRGLPYLFLG